MRDLFLDCSTAKGAGESQTLESRAGANQPAATGGKDWGEVNATYDYRDAGGSLLYRVRRSSTKQFTQQRWDGSSWVNGLGGTTPVLFRLPELLATPVDVPVYVCEGEKDVLACVERRLVATCNSGGAGKFRPEFAQHFQGRQVVVVADRDGPGWKHALGVHGILEPVAASVRIVVAAEGKDAFDHFEAGYGPEEFVEMSRKDVEQELALLASAKSTKSDQDCSDGSDRKRNQADLLVDVLKGEGIELWHDSEQVAYATFKVNGHQENAPLDSKSFRMYCERLAYKATGRTFSDQAKQSAFDTLAGEARYDGPLYPVAFRVGHHEGRTYLFLADSEWNVVRVSADGWKVIPQAECPVRFIRCGSALPLPEPLRGGTLDDLGQLLNLDSDGVLLAKAFLLGCFLPEGTMPVFGAIGQQGSGKSLGCLFIRNLVDPVRAAIRRLPSDEAGMAAAVQNGFILAYDNLSGMKSWQSDALCGISSGAGFARRSLYTNADEHVVEGRRPIMLNGIDDMLTRPDLADRAMVANFQPIHDGARKLESELQAAFTLLRPRLLGALLDCVSRALRDRSAVTLSEKPRLADFAQWCLAGLGQEDGGSFIEAFKANRREQHQAIADGDGLAGLIVKLVESRGNIEGPLGEILRLLVEVAGGEASRLPLWFPKDGRRLSDQLRRIAPVLKDVGILVEQLPRTARVRPWRIRATSSPALASPPSPASSDEGPRTRLEPGEALLSDDELDDVADDAPMTEPDPIPSAASQAGQLYDRDDAGDSEESRWRTDL